DRGLLRYLDRFEHRGLGLLRLDRLWLWDRLGLGLRSRLGLDGFGQYVVALLDGFGHHVVALLDLFGEDGGRWCAVGGLVAGLLVVHDGSLRSRFGVRAGTGPRGSERNPPSARSRALAPSVRPV